MDSFLQRNNSVEKPNLLKNLISSNNTTESNTNILQNAIKAQLRKKVGRYGGEVHKNKEDAVNAFLKEDE